MDWLTSVKDIKRAQENNQLVVFVGAGVSKNSDVPTWGELIKKIAKEIGYDKCDACSCKNMCRECPDESCEKRYAFTQDEFLRIPEYFYQQHKSPEDTTYFDLIQSTLRGGTGPNAIDDEIFNLLPHHIITTNYDSLLEDSTAVNSQLYTVVSGDSDLMSNASERYIIKMHGDLEHRNTIVLKESDYIDYEQKHPLISTFIRSLLVNHTFVFLGYSLNDYNLNLIIGWINYFRKELGVEQRPSNYLIDSKPATALEKSRLEDKNIYVVDVNSLPEDIVKEIKIPETLTNPIGRKIYSYLRCVSQPKIMQKYIPLEERLVEKYELLKAYSKISYHDLITVYPLGRTTFMDTELVFYDKEMYKQISAILENEDSIVTKTFCRAGISAIHCFEDDSSTEVPNAYDPIDEAFQLYFDNNYVELEKILDTLDPIQKLYYYHLVGKNKEDIEKAIAEIAEKYPANNYAEIILQKTRYRSAVLSFFDRQEEKTHELQQLFDIIPEKWRNATSFLRMLFESAAKNMHLMDKLLEKHEKRYEYKSNTVYSSHAHMHLWELKAYAYDYFFFFIENGLPLHYFFKPKGIL